MTNNNTFLKPEKNAITVWRIRNIITTVVLLSLNIAILFIHLNANEIFTLILLCVSSAVSLWAIIGIFILPPIEYRQWEYLITDDKIHIKHGIFLTEHTIIPIVRIQHVSFSQGIILRKFSLVTLKVHTASGNFKIECLKKEIAEDITQKLNDKLQIRLNAQDKDGVV